MNSWTQMLVELPLLVSILLKVTVVLGVGWILHIFLARRNPRWRVLLWSGVVIGIVLVPILVPLKYLQIRITPPPEPVVIAQVYPVSEYGITQTSDTVAVESTPVGEPHIRNMSQPFHNISQPSFSLSAWLSESIWTIVLFAWGLVAAILASRLIIGFFRIKKIIDSSLPGPTHLQQLLDRVAGSFDCSRKVAVRYSSDLFTPFLSGFHRPVIVLPERMISEEYATEWPAIFAHEVAHLCSSDLLWMFAARLTGVLLWFHPLIWKLRSVHNAACEEVCDAVAADYIGDTESYSSALARVALAVIGTTQIVGGIPMVRSSDILVRLRMLKQNVYSNSLARWLVALSVLIGLAFFMCLGGVKLAYADENQPPSSIEKPLSQVKPNVQVEGGEGTVPSQAWYVLRQWNAGPLLLGLSQRLGKVIESSERTDPVWTGKEQGGSLKLDIAVQGDVAGEIFIGFFKDSTWSQEPVQVRRFPGTGQYIVENLPPGKHQIGAMIGSLPVATALGVQKTWPKPVEISSATTATAQVLVSEDFQKRTSGWYNKSVSSDFVGDWKNMNPDNLLQGRLTGPEGRPIAFAEIMIREHNPGARGIKAPNRGTNEQGYYKYDGINWPYKVVAVWKDLMPSVLGNRYQQMYLNRVLEGPQTVNFKFEDFPTGTATLTGRVSDQNGDPLTEFFIAARTQFDWTEKLKNPDGKYYNVVGYRASFISEDGSFKLDNLPSGDFTVRVTPFNIQAYESQRGEEVMLKAGKTKNIDLEVIAKNIFYGRVLIIDHRQSRWYEEGP